MTDWLEDTRISYDTVAESYARMYGDELDGDLVDLALIGLFGELATNGVGGPVIDIGCGPGRIAAYLHDRGLDVIGLDLSPGMVDVARRRYPGLRFDVGSMTDLDLPDGSAGAAVLWYSLVHVPDTEMLGILGHVHRVLRPGGLVLVGWHIGDRVRLKSEGYGGHPMKVRVYQRPVDRMVGWLRDAGFEVDTEIVRSPDDEVPQGRLLAHRR